VQRISRCAFLILKEFSPVLIVLLAALCFLLYHSPWGW
jgi:hypothetical protein